MKHFPIFLSVTGHRILLSGGGDAALAKLRLLLKTEAALEVFCENPASEIIDWAAQNVLNLHRRALTAHDLQGATLFYAADEDRALDAKTSDMARAANVLFNIVDNLHDSAFITPAIVDRDPVVVAIGTEGAAPVLARAIKADVEANLPTTLGPLARIAKAFRGAVDVLPMGRKRRDFWSSFYFGAGPIAYDQGGETAVKEALNDLLTKHVVKDAPSGHVDFVGAGPGDPDLLTMKARNALDKADVVIYDRLVSSEILELARREAHLINVGKQGFGPSTPQGDIDALIVEHSLNGAHVVRLKSGDPTVFGRLDEELDAVSNANVSYRIIPGITAASAAAANIGQSLTKRGRNSGVRLITGHDLAGYVDHDWATLAAEGQVAAIYMGKKSARFMQGRLLMHGAAAQTPVTIIENASRVDQRIIATNLGHMSGDVHNAALKGAALVLYGLAPRAAQIAAENILNEELA
ncbi:uroporphyrin-III C-methyltransferase [Rhodobacteraceae bacterium HTCC2150]|nr:uroporphyrin-III C-methyltransferase [Rhodobacteraceae bacterium HTCC2150]